MLAGSLTLFPWNTGWTTLKCWLLFEQHHWEMQLCRTWAHFGLKLIGLIKQIVIIVGLCLEHHWQHDFHRLDIEHSGLQTPLTFPPAALKCLLVEWHNFMLRQTQMPISDWSLASLRLKNCIKFMCSGKIVLALPQCHCDCFEASVLRQHMSEVCSGSSKVSLQHGQDPLLAPVNTRYIATVMVLIT